MTDQYNHRKLTEAVIINKTILHKKKLFPIV